MPFTLVAAVEEPPHHWRVLQGAADPSDPTDPVVALIAAELRAAYGETHVLDRVAQLEADPSVAQRFDTEAIIAAIREGLPDASAEQKKPAPLRNYRSETGEMVARVALRKQAGVAFPVAGQLTKGNANQPILGFDGWGLLRAGQDSRLVLVQVKCTDDPRRPPGEATRLHAECQRAPDERGKIARALTALAAIVTDQDLLVGVVRMLQLLGNGTIPPIVVAPVIVRGEVASTVEDLGMLRAAPPHARVVGTSVGVGAELDSFGRAVVTKAGAA